MLAHSEDLSTRSWQSSVDGVASSSGGASVIISGGGGDGEPMGRTPMWNSRARLQPLHSSTSAKCVSPKPLSS